MERDLVAEAFGSQRLARDIREDVAGGAKVYTRPWWDQPKSRDELTRTLDYVLERGALDRKLAWEFS